jgi:hypothetical protein
MYAALIALPNAMLNAMHRQWRSLYTKFHSPLGNHTACTGHIPALQIVLLISIRSKLDVRVHHDEKLW